MTRSTNSFPRRTSFACMSLIVACLAFGAMDVCAQTPSQQSVDPYQKISFRAKAACSVPGNGEVTALVKNGVELSVTDDWDCDGVPDAYDDCVGMPDPDQVDSDGNGIGDACAAATTVKTGLTIKARSDAKAEYRKAKAVKRHSRLSVRGGRRRPEHTGGAKSGSQNRKPSAARKSINRKTKP